MPAAADLAGRPATATAPAPVEPMRSWPSGRYQDELVVVEPGAAAGVSAAPHPDGRIGVRHGLRPADIDDEMAGPLAAALAPYTADPEIFQRAFTGLVLTAHPRARDAWALFYANSLARLDHAQPGYSAIYRQALRLLDGGRIADLGCGFGFLSLHLARHGARVTACDVHPGATGLLRAAAARLGRPVEVFTGDAGRLPWPAGRFDSVALLHVLEHVDEAAARRLLREAMRLARLRVVVAVPYEQQPDPLFGHIRTLSPAGLAALGAATGWPYQVLEHHGGWLVLDHPLATRSYPHGGIT